MSKSKIVWSGELDSLGHKIPTLKANTASLRVEEKGLENQIKRIKDLMPSKEDVECNTLGSAKYLQEQLTTIVEDLEDIKTGIKEFNDGAES